MSTTTSPVTQTDVVAVNSAVRKSVGFPLADENGSIRSSVPTRIVIRKLTGIVCAGDNFFCFDILSLVDENKSIFLPVLIT